MIFYGNTCAITSSLLFYYCFSNDHFNCSFLQLQLVQLYANLQKQQCKPKDDNALAYYNMKQDFRIQHNAQFCNNDIFNLQHNEISQQCQHHEAAHNALNTKLLYSQMFVPSSYAQNVGL